MIAIMMFGAWLAARTPAQTPADAIIARVNGEAVMLSQLKEAALDQEVPLAALTSLGLDGEGYRRALSQLVDETLLAQKAIADGIKPDEMEIAREVDKMIDRLREVQGSEARLEEFLKSHSLDLSTLRRMLTARERQGFLTAEVVARRVTVDARAIEAFTAERLAAGKPIEEVELAQILFRCPAAEQAGEKGKARYQAALEAAREAGAQPSRFSEIASRLSDDPAGRAAGGYLGWLDPRSMLPALGERAAQMKPGEISTPIATEQGFHVLLLLRRRTTRDLLFAQEFANARARLLDDLRARASIQFFDLEGRTVKYAGPAAGDAPTTATHLAP